MSFHVFLIHLSREVTSQNSLIHDQYLPDSGFLSLFHKMRFSGYHYSHFEKYSSYGSPDQSGMFSGCLTVESLLSMSQIYWRLIGNYSFSDTNSSQIRLEHGDDAERAVNRQPGYRAGNS